MVFPTIPHVVAITVIVLETLPGQNFCPGKVSSSSNEENGKEEESQKHANFMHSYSTSTANSYVELFQLANTS